MNSCDDETERDGEMSEFLTKSIKDLLEISESFDDSFSFLDPDSTEPDKWLISSETTIQGYMQFITKMPSFAGCDFLSMPKKPGELL
mgnify:CR=1 FL=1